jgi:hypothetical protein
MDKQGIMLQLPAEATDCSIHHKHAQPNFQGQSVSYSVCVGGYFPMGEVAVM